MRSEVFRNPDTPRRLRFCFGAPVHGVDGALGVLSQVLLKPGSLIVDGVVLRSGFLLMKEVRAPLEAVISATEAGAQLDWTAQEAAERGEKQARFAHEERRNRAKRVWKARPSPLRPDYQVVADALPVEGRQGSVGHLRQLFVDGASGEVIEWVIETGLFNRRAFRLPATLVRALDGDRLTVDAGPATIAQLPIYRSDRELRADILDMWFHDRVLRPHFLRGVFDVDVTEGVATVRGHVDSRSAANRLELRAYAVPGVLAVHSEVVMDEVLVRWIAEALAADPRTAWLRPRVTCADGVLFIAGEARDHDQREAATQVAAGVHGVRGVFNHLRVSGDDPPGPARLGVRGLLQPRVGQRVFTRDGAFGRVTHVLLSARDRLVSGIVVGGDLPCGETGVRSRYPHEWPLRRRSIRIPAEWISAANSEVLLRVGHAEAAALRDFSLGNYRQPQAGWSPPYPYRRDEVLLPISSLEARKPAAPGGVAHGLRAYAAGEGVGRTSPARSLNGASRPGSSRTLIGSAGGLG